jgi:hypothetical protein
VLVLLCTCVCFGACVCVCDPAIVLLEGRYQKRTTGTYHAKTLVQIVTLYNAQS